MAKLSLRAMVEADLPAAHNLRQIIGWNQTLADWQRLLRLEPHGCFVAMKGPDLVGTVTTTSYGRALAWIGMVLVHPEHRRQGIARGLMERAIHYLQRKEIQVIKLDATPAGQALYEQLGFVSEWTLTRWQRGPTAAPSPKDLQDSVARPLREDDWPAIIQLDKLTLGAARPQLLRSLAESSKCALACPGTESVTGWGLLRPGANADYLGPLASVKPDGGLALILDLLLAAAHRPLFWDVPDANGRARTIAKEAGFQPLRPLTRMRLGPPMAAVDVSAVLGIADPAVG